MQINTIKSYRQNLNFQETNNKKNNVDKKVKTLQDCAILTSMFALVTGYATLEPSRGMKQIKGGKLTLGLLCTSLVFFISSKLVKLYQHSKQ